MKPSVLRAANHEPRYDAIVIGGGFAGLGVARALVLKKKKVLVLEKHVSGASSEHASGILDPFVDLDFRPEILALTLPAVKKYPAWIRQIESETGMKTGYEKHDLLYLSSSRSEEKKLKQFQRIPGVSQKVQVRWLSRGAIVKMESGVSPKVSGGLHLRGVARVIPSRMMNVLRTWLSQKGVTFLSIHKTPDLIIENQRAIGIRLGSRSLRAVQVVGCLGAWAGAQPGSSALHEPVQPIRGQILIYPRKKPLKVMLHTADGGYLIPWNRGQVLAGSTVEKAGFDSGTTKAGMKKVSRYAARLLPELAGVRPVQNWAGLRPRNLVGHPRIGKTGISGYYVANGYFRCGILIGFYAGELLTRLMLTGKTPRELRHFSAA